MQKSESETDERRESDDNIFFYQWWCQRWRKPDNE